ncbi:FRAS1-related extracellular matrix protein 3-like [Amphiura filiformis]|uniref:FRAS1-related extracellular matrix protein 3-like n=1 Tax=Amphiura filiformis TaxID=82378 RepID=UPI003B2272A3
MAWPYCRWVNVLATVLTLITTVVLAQEYSIVNSEYEIREGIDGGELTVEVSRVGGTEAGSVRLRMSNTGTGTPATAEDYDTSDIQLDFAATATAQTQSATIDIVDDSKYEANGEIFTMTLTIIAGFTGSVVTSQSQVTIEDNDSQFYIDTDNSDTSVAEDIGTAHFTIKRRGYLTSPATVQFSTVEVSGANAVEGQDYGGITGRVLSFSQNSDTQTVDVEIINDMEMETTSEIFDVVLSDPTNGELGTPYQVDVEILNDDGVYAFTQATYVVSESANSVEVCVTRTSENTIEQREVLLTTAATGADSASANGDYRPLTSTTGLLKFGSADNQECVDISILEDSIVESSETFSVQITELEGELGTPATAIVTITDNDATFKFETATAQVAESTGSITVRIQRQGYLQTTGTVRVRSSPGSATSTTDYSFVSQVVSFTNSISGTSTQSITISIARDRLFEGNEVFYLDLESPSGGQVIAPSRMTITILDDDTLPPITIRPRDDGLTDAQIAGIAIGAVLGALALIGIPLALCCCLLGCPCCPGFLADGCCPYWLTGGSDRKRPLVYNQQQPPPVIIQRPPPAIIQPGPILQPGLQTLPLVDPGFNGGFNQFDLQNVVVF